MKKFYLLLILFFSQVYFSQWVQTNGPSWYVSRIYFEGNDIIVCDNFKITRSSDDGNSYYDFGTGFSPSSVAPNRIFTSISKLGSTWIAVAQNEGIYRSTDSGATWTLSNTGISTIYVNTSVVKGTDFYVGSNLGVHKSTDNGLTWTLINNTIQGIFSINILYVDGNNIFAGTSGKGIFVSSDNGVTWADRSISTYVSILRNVWCFTKDANYIYAGTGGGGVYRTANNGVNWTYCNNGNGTYLNDIVSDGTNLYAATSTGIYTSADSGNTWTNFQANLTSTFFSQGSNVSAIAINNSKLYIGVKDNRVWKRILSTSLYTENLEKSKSQIYPNPFVDNLNISTQENGLIYFYDISGKLISTEKINKGNNSFNKSSLQKGVYIYQIKGKDGNVISSGKVIKK